jgi:hypothetical protein
VNSALRKQAEKDYEKAKDMLLKWLGDESSKTLSDGRVFSQMKQHIDAETELRKAFDKTLTNLSPKPAA